MGLYPGSIRPLTNASPADVALVDVNGNQITTLSGTPPSTSTITSVASSATSVLLLAANANRKKFFIFNDSTKSLSIAFGAAAASLTNRTLVIAAAGVYESEMNDTTDAIQGIWASANGFARITEMT